MILRGNRILKGDILILDGVTPSNIPDLKFWIDANDASTINSGTPVNNDVITTLVNKAPGSGLTISMVSTPLYKTNSFGIMSGIQVTGTKYLKSQIDSEVSLNKTVLFVYRINNYDAGGSAYVMLINQSNSFVTLTGNLMSLAIFTSGVNQLKINDSSTLLYNVALANSIVTPATTVLFQGSNVQNMVKYAYKYNVPNSRPANLSTSNTPYLFIGGGTGNTEIHINEFLIYNRVLSDLELNSVRKYLKTKWNL